MHIHHDQIPMELYTSLVIKGLIDIVVVVAQAWSNGVYKSVKHRVIASKAEVRLSTAFFYCPKSEAVIGSCCKVRPAVYRQFSFHEYRVQVKKDVEATGDKVGLARFLL